MKDASCLGENLADLYLDAIFSDEVVIIPGSSGRCLQTALKIDEVFQEKRQVQSFFTKVLYNDFNDIYYGSFGGIRIKSREEASRKFYNEIEWESNDNLYQDWRWQVTPDYTEAFILQPDVAINFSYRGRQNPILIPVDWRRDNSLLSTFRTIGPINFQRDSGQPESLTQVVTRAEDAIDHIYERFPDKNVIVVAGPVLMWTLALKHKWIKEKNIKSFPAYYESEVGSRENIVEFFQKDEEGLCYDGSKKLTELSGR